MPKADTPNETKVTWHPYWRDRTGDVIFKSSDGVQFRASSYRLSEASTVFADMLQIPHHQTRDRDPEVVELPFRAPTIDVFLDCISSRVPAPIPSDILTVVELHEFVQIYDCSKMLQQVKDAFDRAFVSYPLDAIIVASSRNDVEMARKWMKCVIGSNRMQFGEANYTPNTLGRQKALPPPEASSSTRRPTPFDCFATLPTSAFASRPTVGSGSKQAIGSPVSRVNALPYPAAHDPRHRVQIPITTHATMFWKFMDTLPPHWQQALLRLVLQSDGQDMRILKDWRTIADDFKP